MGITACVGISCPLVCRQALQWQMELLRGSAVLGMVWEMLNRLQWQCAEIVMVDEAIFSCEDLFSDGRGQKVYRSFGTLLFIPKHSTRKLSGKCKFLVFKFSIGEFVHILNISEIFSQTRTQQKNAGGFFLFQVT